MPLFRAFGLGVTLLILQLLVPPVFSQLEDTAIAFLKAGQISANVGSQIAGSAGALEFSNTPLALPRAANIIR